MKDVDFRDPADVDEALDHIRVVPRDKALQLFVKCMEVAYNQGRIESFKEVLDNQRRRENE